MRLHEREALVSKASSDLSGVITEWEVANPELTTSEMLSVMQSCFSKTILGVLKHEIRFERHGSYEIPGGLAPDHESRSILPGPYRTDPRDGNAYRANNFGESKSDVGITDIFGGHPGVITKKEWESWEPHEFKEVT